MSDISSEVINICFIELETIAKDVFREYLTATNHSNIERFFNEWKMTFRSDGPFETEEDQNELTQKITEPDDFMVRLLTLLAPLSFICFIVSFIPLTRLLSW